MSHSSSDTDELLAEIVNGHGKHVSSSVQGLPTSQVYHAIIGVTSVTEIKDEASIPVTPDFERAAAIESETPL